MDTDSTLRDGYLRLHAQGWSVAEAFRPGERVAIYGCNLLGQSLYRDLAGHAQVFCFLDKFPDRTEFAGVPVLGAYSEAVWKLGQEPATAIVADGAELAAARLLLSQRAPAWRVYPLSAALASVGRYHSMLAWEPEARVSPLLGQLAGKRAVLVTFTAYSLLMYLLLHESREDTVFLLVPKFPPELARAMLRRGWYCDMVREEACHGEASYMDRARLYAGYAAEHGLAVYGHDHCRTAEIFVQRGLHFAILEDGGTNYHEDNAVRVALLRGLPYVPFGFASHARKVCLTGLKEMPASIAKKAELLDLRRLWDGQPPERRKAVLDLFGFPGDMVRRLREEGRDFLLLTEYFSVAGALPEARQIEIYREILARYDAGRMLIKPHPVDTIDYAAAFPGIPVLPRQFPAELLAFLGMRPAKVISLLPCTPTYGIFRDCQIETYEDIYGKEIRGRSRDVQSAIDYAIDAAGLARRMASVLKRHPEGVAVYGLGRYADFLAEHFPHQVRGFLDRSREDGEFHGHPILPLEGLARRGIRGVAIAASIGAEEAIAERIQDACAAQGLALYGLHREDLQPVQRAPRASS